MKKLLTISYSIIILGIVTLGILSVLLDKNNHDLFNKQEQRYQSYLLADQLRQSSDDLTRMARTYVVTGDEKYERMYWDILAIRNGKLARPKSYERIYWDLILNYGEKPRLDGETIPLQTLMQQMGINEAEFTKLRISQQNSDDLVIAETIAMNAMKGLYDDGTGNYIKQDEPDYEMAIKIMHNIDYHKYKAKIMQPIDEFLEMLDARTKNSVVEHMAISEFLVVTIEILVVVLIMLALIIAIFVTQRILKQVGGEPAKIAHITKQVATGDLNIKFEENATGIYASIQVMVQNLNIIINDVVRISEGLANGNLNINLQKKYKGDFAKIQHSLTDSITNQNKVVADIIQVSKGLADGDLNIGLQAEYKGDFAKIQHALLVSLSNQREVVADIIKVSKGLAKGDLNIMPEATYRGDFIKIKKALQKTALKLTKTTNKNIQQNWLKTGQTDLSKILQGEQDITSLTKDIITFLCKYVDAQIGLFYLLRDNEQQPYLQVISSHAYVENTDRPDKYLIGEGLIGQAALELKTLYFYQTTKECPAIIRSGLANSIPHHLLVLPCLYQGVVKAVLEIGSNKKLSKIQTKFLEQTLLNIGIAINTASSRTEIQKLLQQSQNQTEELQIQQEKLQKNNEELQSQSEDLQTQSEEMQSQQEELRQTNEVLEERTKDLEQQKIDVQDKNHALEINRIEMEKAQTAIVLKAEELELASKYKSEFLANMSHELRTPLNSLLILSQLLVDNKDGNLVTKQIEYAKTINSAGNDLLTLINDILDLSKVEAGKIEVQWEDVILNNLFTSIEQKFAPIADEKGINFSLKIADNLDPTLRTDSQRIKQIINNLLSNAFKFTSEGEVKLLVQRPTEIPANIEQLELSKTIAINVIDSGIGIPKDKQQSVFEAFQQADGSTSRLFGGTGLGLSISRQLARLIGGDIVLTSEIDKGSTFTLYLPESVSQSEFDTTEIKHELSPHPTKPLTIEPPLLTEEYQSPKDILLTDDRQELSTNDKVILIIEDDRKFANILIDLAREKGFKCILAEDGITGLQLAKEFKPKAIVLDIGLPRLDGLTLMSKLKDNHQTRHIPVHFISANDQVVYAKKMGAIGYLVKPVTMEKLTEAFKKIETFLAKTVKKLLIVTDNKLSQQKIINLVGDEKLQLEVAITGDNACQKLQKITYDCVILDMDLEQGSGGELLQKMLQEKNPACKIPIIVYTERNLTSKEEALLASCSDEIPIKTVNSPENLVDETTLFLHQVEANLSSDKRKMLHMVHDKKAILKHKKVLIVDDDERNIFALATILENQDAEVICGVNGREGLEFLEKHDDIAIVLMDIMMPEMDGYEAIRKIREQRKYRDLPIIALTAKAMKDDKAKCIKAGANDYLSKPVETDKLLSLMRVWLYR